ncbi:MAG TPA: CPBP family glutamic-type intramembrane protease [Polyangiaceae bacterium]|nr:CPBP family glutamic-type intramembrane protease [Polyangiaceae bacterium]
MRAHFEILAALATGTTFVVANPFLSNKLYFIVPCMLAWLVYLVSRVRRDREALREWGLRTDNLRAASRAPLAFTALATLFITVYRVLAGYRPLPSEALWMFLLYPLWGLFQQLFVQAMVAGNLLRLGLSRPWVILVAAGLFGAAHLPDAQLTLLCLLVGLVWTACFVRIPNLLPLALAHGWLGTLVYYWLLERPPLAP